MYERALVGGVRIDGEVRLHFISIHLSCYLLLILIPERSRVEPNQNKCGPLSLSVQSEDPWGRKGSGWDQPQISEGDSGAEWEGVVGGLGGKVKGGWLMRRGHGVHRWFIAHAGHHRRRHLRWLAVMDANSAAHYFTFSECIWEAACQKATPEHPGASLCLSTTTTTPPALAPAAVCVAAASF